jgi:excisionase family DNA binding protein
MSENLITVDQLAAKLQVSKNHIRNLYRTKQIPVIRMGHRCLRFDYDQVRQALEAKQ